MKHLEFTLQSGLIMVLTPEDIRLLKPQLDVAFENLEKSNNELFRKLTNSELALKFEEMSNGELLQFAKENEEFMTFSSYQIDSFTLKIWQEILKREGSLGYKQIRHLSTRQRDYLEKFGLITRPWKMKKDV